MVYKGYTGIVEIDEEAGVLFGRVVGLRDVITFQGETIAEARRAFEKSVDSYLEFCQVRGESPEKPYSGRFVVRISPELHRDLVSVSEALKLSLNAFVEQALAEGVTRGEWRRLKVVAVHNAKPITDKMAADASTKSGKIGSLPLGKATPKKTAPKPGR